MSNFFWIGVVMTLSHLRQSVASVLRNHVFQVVSMMILVMSAWLMAGAVQNNEDFYTLTMTSLNKSYLFILASCLMLLVEFYSDYRKGIQQKAAYNAIETNGLYLAIYLGARVLALAGLAGAIFR